MYNGWSNYETWNVALWLQNDEGLYHLMRDCSNYKQMVEFLRESGIIETPDQVAYNDSSLDLEELDALFEEEHRDEDDCDDIDDKCCDSPGELVHDPDCLWERMSQDRALYNETIYGLSFDHESASVLKEVACQLARTIYANRLEDSLPKLAAAWLKLHREEDKANNKKKWNRKRTRS